MAGKARKGKQQGKRHGKGSKEAGELKDAEVASVTGGTNEPVSKISTPSSAGGDAEEGFAAEFASVSEPEPSTLRIARLPPPQRLP